MYRIRLPDNTKQVSVHLARKKNSRPCQSTPAPDFHKLEKLFLKKTLPTPAFDESKTVLPHIDIYQVADDVVGHRRAQGRHSSHNIYIVYGLRASAQKLPSSTKLIRSYTLIHPRQREGLRVLKICYKECIIISVARRGDTRGPKYNPKTAITVEDSKRGATSYNIV